MLPAGSRLRRSSDFARAVRSGVRAGRRLLVVHLLVPAAGTGTGPALGGFVVSKAVGGSVVRHQVVRRLRPLLAGHLANLPTGSLVVVRALAPAATASSHELASDLDGALRSALGRSGWAKDGTSGEPSLPK